MSNTLDRFDEVMVGATNDEVIELANRVFEELAERVGNVSRLALEEGKRDLINEAAVFAESTYDLLPLYGRGRARAVWHYVHDCQTELAEAIAARAENEEPDRWRHFRIRETPAARRAAETRLEEQERKAAELLASVDLAPESVLEAFTKVAQITNGPIRLGEVALALCPDAEPTDMPGRQVLINRVSAVVRKLSLEGKVVKASESDYARNRTCRWALPSTDEDRVRAAAALKTGGD